MAKRFSKQTLNWAELEKLVPPNQKGKYFAFKAKSEGYLRRVQANPPEPPKINWEEYKKTVPIPGLVDKYKAAYESLKVPVPQDTMSAKVDEQWKSLEPDIKEYCAQCQQEIDKASKELQRINALPKFEEITMELFYDLYPDIALDPVKRPTLWPHVPEEQPGYQPPPVSEPKKN